MLSVYADDSSDGKRERIFVIAGIMGTQEEWDVLEVDWKRCTNGKIFHATDCKAGYGVYKGIPKGHRDKEYRDLINILVQTKMWGYGVAVDLKGFKTFLPEALYDAPYYHCFMRVLFYFTNKASMIIPQQMVKFTFDINPKTRYNAAFSYENFLKNHKDWERNSIIEEVSFATNSTVGIQVADLFAGETMKYCDERFGLNRRPDTASIYELLKTGRFKCDYVGSEYFQKLKNHIDNFKQNYSPKEYEDYNKWLLKHRRKDNTENRTKFLMYLESMKD